METQNIEEVTTDVIDEESIAAATLHPGSKPVSGDPKSKIDYITHTIGAMHSMRKDDLVKWFDQAMSLIGKEASSLPGNANEKGNENSVRMKSGSHAVGNQGPSANDPMPKLDHKNNPLAGKISVKEDVEEMFIGEELSEEFKEKATTLFEAAVNARALVEMARLEEEYNVRLEEQVTQIVEDMEKNLDTYLDYVVEKWMEDNQVAIESSLRNEVMEEFIGGLKNLFAEHYIDMPEEKIDVVESLASKVEELESALDETINENSELRKVVLESKRQEIVDDMCEGLTLTQAEKFTALSEGVDFDGNLVNYSKKLEIVKNTYFSESKSSSNIEEETFEAEIDNNGIVHSDPTINKYAQAISRTVKK